MAAMAGRWELGGLMFSIRTLRLLSRVVAREVFDLGVEIMKA